MPTVKTVKPKTTTKTTSASTIEENIDENKPELKTVHTAELKKYSANDLVPTSSVTQGELLLVGRKSGILYRWGAYGDVTEVEYQDLYTLKASRSGYIYKPRFVIEDEELLADPRWSDIKKLYDGLLSATDLDEIMNLNPKDFRATLEQLPKGILESVKIEAGNRIEAGTFDSVSKIKTVDEICGTDFFNLMK